MNVSVVWLNQDEARIFQISEDRMSRDVIRARPVGFYNDLGARLAVSGGRILILGPAGVGPAFHEFLKHQSPTTAERVVSCETLEHPADHEIAAFALKAIRAK